MEPRNVTTIINKNLNPRLESYFRKLMTNKQLQVTQVHDSWTYEPLVHQTKAWSNVGVFYDYLIRKEMFNLLGVEAEDQRATNFEDHLLDYEELLNDIRGDIGDGDAQPHDEDEAKGMADAIFEEIDVEGIRKPVASYQKYKDPKNATLDIIEDIFNTSTLHSYYFGGSMMAYDVKLLNMDNIKTVVKHVGTFQRKDVLLNPFVGGDYFRGDADLIVDDVLLDIKVSMYPLKLKQVKGKKSFYQLILYALGAYLNYNKEIRKFKIYNPLLGMEYFMEIPELDFIEFLALVEDIEPL